MGEKAETIWLGMSQVGPIHEETRSDQVDVSDISVVYSIVSG